MPPEAGIRVVVYGIRRRAWKCVPLAARDNHAALLAAVPYDVAGASRYRFEVVMLRAGAIETFGTVAIAQFVSGHGEMTARTAHRAPAFWD